MLTSRGSTSSVTMPPSRVSRASSPQLSDPLEVGPVLSPQLWSGGQAQDRCSGARCTCASVPCGALRPNPALYRTAFKPHKFE